MLEFIRQHAASVAGVIHGFDRLRFRGTLRRIASVRGLGSFLHYAKVLLKDAGAWMNEQTERVKKASLKVADAQDRPVQYVIDPSARKEQIARDIAERDGINEGLVCVLTAVEPCWSFDVHRNDAGAGRRAAQDPVGIGAGPDRSTGPSDPPGDVCRLPDGLLLVVPGQRVRQQDLAEPLCRRTREDGRSVRALNPMGAQDAALLETVNRGEFAINGFRNRDVRRHLYATTTTDPKQQKRRSAAVTRKLRLLRSHGLINKVSRTHRYVLTNRDRNFITTVLAARCADAQALLKAA